jgi:ribosomal protein L18E
VTKRQQSGMRGVFLVAGELSRLGYSVALTARNAAGADLVVFSVTTAEARSIEVKTNAKRANFWLVNERARELSAPSHFYAFVNISTAKEGAERFEYFVVPSAVVARKTAVQKRAMSTWYSFSLKDAEPYRGKWSQLGKQ